jgi:copper resistance protein B
MSPKVLALAASFAIVSAGSPANAQMQMGSADMASSAAPFGAPVDDEHVFYHAMLSQLEGRFGRDNNFRWEGEGWAGTDMNRVLLRSEGTVSSGKVEDGQQEIFYSRPISTYFNALVGTRYDLDSGPGRGWAALGVEGLAPLFFHVAATGYMSDTGHYAAKLEGSYDLLLTQTLILQPQIEMNLYSKADPSRMVGSGLSDIDTGLRLRYEISRKFAPYLAVTYENKFGQTAGFARSNSDPTSKLRFTFGVRVWL